MGSTLPKGSAGSIAPHHSPSRGHTTVSAVPSTLGTNNTHQNVHTHAHTDTAEIGEQKILLFF